MTDWQLWRLGESVYAAASHEIALQRRERLHAAVVKFAERHERGYARPAHDATVEFYGRRNRRAK